MISVYKLARKILPPSVQAWLGNRHKVKRNLIDPFIWNFTQHPQEEVLARQKVATLNVPREVLEENPFIDPVVAASFRRWYGAEQVQQVVRVRGKVFIEPETGWPMGSGNTLFLSLYPAGASTYMPVPAYKTIWSKKPAVHLEKVICLRDAIETGYSHFYTDLLPKLELMRRAGANLKEYTIVISKKVAETAYGRFLLANTPLLKEAGGIFLQERDFVLCDEAYFSNIFGNPSNNRDIFLEVARNVKAASPPQSEAGERKIFLTRGKHRRRTVRNGDEIREILTAKGFECVDADLLSLPEQIELFANCRHLVGIHGAGLVNMLYRHPEKLSLFEICEPMHPVLALNAQYHNIAVTLGFDYGAVHGEQPSMNDHSFTMPPQRFEKAFNAFWAVHGT